MATEKTEDPVKKFKIPKKLSEVADAYYTAREERLALDRQAAALKERESALRNYLIDNIPKSDAAGVTGKLVNVLVKQKEGVRIADFDAVMDYVIKNRKKGSFALLRRQFNETAIKEIWNQGGKVPGVEKNTYVDISVTRLG